MTLLHRILFKQSKEVTSLLCFVICLVSSGYAQPNNNWVLTPNVRIDFTTDTPQVYNDVKPDCWWRHYPSGDSTYIQCGSTAISFCDGSLALYASGKYVYNRWGEVIDVDNDVSKNFPQNQQFLMTFIQVPQDSNKFYLFYGKWGPYRPSGVSNRTGDIYYTIYDLSLNNGKGGPVSNYKNLKFSGVGQDGFTFMEHSNGRSFWVVASPDGDEFLAHMFDSGGVVKTVKSSLLSSSKPHPGHMRFSPTGDKIIRSGAAFRGTFPADCILEILSFDRGTGRSRVIKYLWPNQKRGDQIINTYGWSPDATKLYLEEREDISPGQAKIYLKQYDLNASSFYNSGLTLYSYTVVKLPSVQILLLGKDSRLYYAKNDSSLSVVHFPNRRGLAAGFQDTFPIDTRKAKVDAHHIPYIYSPPYQIGFTQHSPICSDTLYLTNYSDTPHYRNFVWFFGDGDSATGYHAQHAYQQGGKYLVRLRAENKCGARQWYSDSVEIRPPVRAAMAKTDSLRYSCGSATVGYRYSDTSGVADSAWWTVRHLPDSGHSALPDSLQPEWGYRMFSLDTTFTFTKGGSWLVGVAASGTWCQDTAWDTLQVLLLDTPQVQGVSLSPVVQSGLGEWAIKAVGDSLASRARLLSKKISDTSWTLSSWQPMGDTLAFQSADIGRYQLVVEAQSVQGCTRTDTLRDTVEVVPLPKAGFSLLATDTACFGYSFRVSNTSQDASPQGWELDGAPLSLGQDSLLRLDTGTHSIRLVSMNGYSCSDTADTVLVLKPAPRPLPFLVNINGSAGCAPFHLNMKLEAPESDSSLTYRLRSSVDPLGAWTSATSLAVQLDTALENAQDYSLDIQAINRHGCTRDTSISISVYNPAQATLALADSTPGCGEVTYNITSSTLHAEKTVFTLDKDTLKDAARITLYDTLNHQLIMVALSPHGCHDTASLSLKAAIPPPPHLVFSIFSDTPACQPYLIKMKPDTFPPGNLGWQFEKDGQRWGYSMLSDTFILGLNEEGIYQIHLHYIDRNGCHLYGDTVPVRVLPQPVAEASAFPASGCSPLSFELRRKHGEGSYFWTTTAGDTLLAPDTLLPLQVASPQDTTLVYTLHSFLADCSDSSSVSVSIRSLQPSEQGEPLLATIIQQHEKAPAHARLRFLIPQDAQSFTLLKSFDAKEWTPLEQFIRQQDTFQFTDSFLDLEQRAPFYKVDARDGCGNASPGRAYLRPVFIEVESAQEGASALLEWNPYSGSPAFAGRYSLSRSQRPALLDTPQVQIATTPSTSYLDQEFFDQELWSQCYRLAMRDGDDTALSNIACLQIEPRLYIPNVFTPTDDGLNDGWGITASSVKRMQLRVYSRWGTLVWEGHTPTERWDGTFKGAGVPDGAYLFYLRLQHGDGHWVTKRGTVEVVR